MPSVKETKYRLRDSFREAEVLTKSVMIYYLHLKQKLESYTDIPISLGCSLLTRVCRSLDGTLLLDPSW